MTGSGGGNKISPLFYAKTFGISEKGRIFAVTIILKRQTEACQKQVFFMLAIAALYTAACTPVVNCNGTPAS